MPSITKPFSKSSLATILILLVLIVTAATVLNDTILPVSAANGCTENAATVHLKLYTMKNTYHTYVPHDGQVHEYWSQVANFGCMNDAHDDCLTCDVRINGFKIEGSGFFCTVQVEGGPTTNITFNLRDEPRYFVGSVRLHQIQCFSDAKYIATSTKLLTARTDVPLTFDGCSPPQGDWSSLAMKRQGDFLWFGMWVPADGNSHSLDQTYPLLSCFKTQNGDDTTDGFCQRCTEKFEWLSSNANTLTGYCSILFTKEKKGGGLFSIEIGRKDGLFVMQQPGYLAAITCYKDGYAPGKRALARDGLERGGCSVGLPIDFYAGDDVYEVHVPADSKNHKLGQPAPQLYARQTAPTDTTDSDCNELTAQIDRAELKSSTGECSLLLTTKKKGGKVFSVDLESDVVKVFDTPGYLALAVCHQEPEVASNGTIVEREVDGPVPAYLPPPNYQNTKPARLTKASASALQQDNRDHNSRPKPEPKPESSATAVRIMSKDLAVVRAYNVLTGLRDAAFGKRDGNVTNTASDSSLPNAAGQLSWTGLGLMALGAGLLF